MNLRTSASLVRRVKLLCGTQGPTNRYLGLVIYDWGGKLHTHQSKSGDGLMRPSVIRPIALFGTVAVMVTLTVVVTLFSY
jgi:hypothetical protein